jgi:AcrR family transcriptional regulator
MPKVSEEYRDAKRREITKAAQRAIIRSGFGASMAEIIAESGLSAGAIYGHFDSKSDLVVEVATSILGRRILTVQELASGEALVPPGALVRAIVAGWLDELSDPRFMVQVWGESVTDQPVLDMMGGLVEQFAAAIAGYIALWHERTHGTDPEAAREIGRAQAPLILATCQGFILQRTVMTRFDDEAYLDAAERYLPR